MKFLSICQPKSLHRFISIIHQHPPSDETVDCSMLKYPVTVLAEHSKNKRPGDNICIPTVDE